MEWAENRGIALANIQPGKPQQNAYVEGYNRTVRPEWLDLYIFESIEEVQQIATEWLWSYSHERPDMGNGRVTPPQELKIAVKILRTSPPKKWGDYPGINSPARSAVMQKMSGR